MIDLKAIPVSALLELHGDVLEELQRRAVVRSSNNPTGDYAELLFSRAFGWTLNGNSSADADAVDADGLRYQIKCRKLVTPRGSRRLGLMRRLPDRPFDKLAAVLIDGKFRVLRGAIIPYEVVLPRAAYVQSTNGWKFILRESTWEIPGVTDVTAELRAAEILI